MHSPKTDDTLWVTSGGYQNLIQQLARKQNEYTEVRANRQVAFELSGDGWHDNPEFNRMQQLEVSLNHAVKQLSEQIARARLIEIQDHARPTQVVSIGSIVLLQRWDHQSEEPLEECWEIVGFDETNTRLRQLGYNAPLAQAILGLQVGEVAEEFRIGARCWDIEVKHLYTCLKDAPLAACRVAAP